MTDTTCRICADCGATFPLPSVSGGAAGYATTRVPLLPRTAPSVRFVLHGESIGRTASNLWELDEAEQFPAAYDVEGEIDDALVATAERSICYACAAALEKETTIATGRACLYLTTKPAEPGTFAGTYVRQTAAGPYRYRYVLSNWPGNAPFRILGLVRESKGFGFGRRYDVRTFHFAGPDGYVWSGRNAGDMQLARCKRTKEKVR